MVAVLFFVPAGLVIAELGAAFPDQGGPYVWARLAFGRYAGSLVALIYFLETPLWVGGSLAITAVAVADRLLVPAGGAWRVVVEHGLHGPAAADLAPSWPVFVLVAPVLVCNFLGFELPSAAAEELRDPARDVPASIVRAGALTCALYAVPLLAIVLVVPADRLTGLTGFIDALATVLTVYGPGAGPAALAAALAFLWILVANGLTWVMASARTQAAASLDGIGPSALGRVAARTGTPLAAALATGWSALALAAALWPGLGTGDPDAHLPHGFAGDRLGFTLAQLVPLAAVLATPSLLARRRPGPLTRPAAQAPPGLGR